MVLIAEMLRKADTFVGFLLKVADVLRTFTARLHGPKLCFHFDTDVCEKLRWQNATGANDHGIIADGSFAFTRFQAYVACSDFFDC